MHTESEKLRFPRGVRFAAAEDIPTRDRAERLGRIAGADIRTGFVLKPTDDPGFSAYIEANVHADQVWEVFKIMCSALLPDVAAPLIAGYGDDPTYGPYTDKAAALSVFEPYIDSLENDGWIEFGLIFQQHRRTEEVYVKPTKDFCVWTNQGDTAEAAFMSQGLSRMDSLMFIDEYPRVTERLVGLPQAHEVVAMIKSAFDILVLR